MEIKVAKVIDDYKLVINKGKDDGIKYGQRFLIYSLEEVIKDPDTGEELERLELVKGTGKTIHVQANISTIKSDMEELPRKTIRKIKKANAFSMVSGFFGPQEIEEISAPDEVPFDYPKVGDIARII